MITDDGYDQFFFQKKVKKLRFKAFFDLNKDLTPVKRLTFSRGESIKDELTHSFYVIYYTNAFLNKSYLH
jgi:hypothetical protein